MAVTALQVELGGGSDPLFHPNIDIFPHDEVDIVHDITKGIPLGDGVADLIFSRDFVEHLLFTDFIKLLDECKRVLRVNGIIKFVTPDINRTVCNHSELNPHVYHMFVGKWDDTKPELRHKMWFTPELMTYILSKEGWKDIVTKEYILDVDHWKEPKFTVRAAK